MRKDIRYVPTPLTVVEAMLDLAVLSPSDFLIDLGSGDGRIPIQAGRRGVRARGVDIDPRLVSRSARNAKEAKVTDLVDFLAGDFFSADIREATVITLYLRHFINLKLMPKLLQDLKPGSRIVSHSFEMDDWVPDRLVEVENKLLYLWIVPEIESSSRPQGATITTENLTK